MEASPVVHPAADVLNAFVLGKLDEATAERVLSHLDVCPDCCAHLSSLCGDIFLAYLRQVQVRSGTALPPGKVLPTQLPAPVPPERHDHRHTRSSPSWVVAAQQQPGGPPRLPGATGVEGNATIARAQKQMASQALGQRVRSWLLVAGVVALGLLVIIGLWVGGGFRPSAETLIARVKEVADLDLVRIPAGEFYMGSEKGDKDAFNDEKPRHKVRISGAFWLGKYKVTVGQFKRFVGSTDYETEAEKAGDEWTWRNPGFMDVRFGQTDEHPVVHVSWNDAKVYCAWLAENTGATVRLPREAEWEYCCRARATTKDWATTKYCFGDSVADLDDYAWHGDNTKPYGPRPCGQKKPNAFGLYDMHGLAWEWCDDSYRTYSDQMVSDPVGSDPVGAGVSRVCRGGSFSYVPRRCRAANRRALEPSDRVCDIGFRVLVSR